MHLLFNCNRVQLYEWMIFECGVNIALSLNYLIYWPCCFRSMPACHRSSTLLMWHPLKRSLLQILRYGFCWYLNFSWQYYILKYSFFEVKLILWNDIDFWPTFWFFDCDLPYFDCLANVHWKVWQYLYYKKKKKQKSTLIVACWYLSTIWYLIELLYS